MSIAQLIERTTPVPASARARAARPDDAPRIAGLIGRWADQGLTIRRTEHEVVATIGQFAVVERTGALIACAAMQEICARTAVGICEIRSVAVDPEAIGSGAGRLAVTALVDRAARAGVTRLVLLTKIPRFFERLGFTEIDVSSAPRAYLEQYLPAQGRRHLGRAVMHRLIEIERQRE